MFIKPDGGETASIDMARCFASYDEALAYCKENHLTGLELVAQMDDKSEMTMAVRETSTNAMKVGSTPDSAARGEITTLAIVETVVAMSLSLFFVIFFQSSIHIIVGALIAPFLLLRSESSSAMAYSIFEAWFSNVPETAACNEGIAARRPIAFRFIWLPVVAVAATVAKILATVVTLISSPGESLRAIQTNWIRIALATDYRHPPELLPGAEADPVAPASLQAFRYEELRRNIMAGPGGFVIHKLTLFAMYVPAILYRLLLKSTSLVYFPLIWVSDMPMTMKGILTLPLERVRRWYAGAVMAVMLAALLIPWNLPNMLPTARDATVLMYVLPVGEFGFWQFGRALAIVITIALYFYARKLGKDSVKPGGRRSKTEARNSENREGWIIKNANRLRAVCALFTLGCFLLIILTL
jgi:hypothetical protein